jgi:hypothetical protein
VVYAAHWRSDVGVGSTALYSSSSTHDVYVVHCLSVVGVAGTLSNSVLAHTAWSVQVLSLVGVAASDSKCLVTLQTL